MRSRVVNSISLSLSPLHLISHMTKRSLLTRELLESMKRTDLQRVCKVRVHVNFTSVNFNPHALNRQERGLKANIKTEEMIELLLDSSPSVLYITTGIPFFSRLIITSSQSPRRTSRQRAASGRGIARQPSNQSRLHSTSTVIIHSDTDEDEAHRAVKPESDAPSDLHSGPVTRTRKARDAQLRLGVGRPTIAGGSGPRAVTRSVSVAKGVRSRSGRGAKPAPAPTVNGESGPFIPLSFAFLRTAFFSLCRSVLMRFIGNETPKLHPTETPEDEPQPPSNHGTPQPRTIENGRIRRTSTSNPNTDRAGVKQIVEEQVCSSSPISILLSCFHRYGPYNARLHHCRGNSNNRHQPILEKLPRSTTGS
jgi:hypothetical protein